MIERDYSESDLHSVIDVYQSAIHSLAAGFYTKRELEAWAPLAPDVRRWKERLAPLRTVVADVGGTIVGFVSYEADGHLDFLFTHPRYARQGIATRLCRQVEASLIAAGIARIFTESSLAALPFFERSGFRIDAEEFVECRGVQLRRYRMHKVIHAA